MNREKEIKEHIKKLEYMLDNYQFNEEIEILFKNIIFNENKFFKKEYKVGEDNE